MITSRKQYVLALLAAAASLSALGEPASATSVAPAPSPSVFVMPGSPSEGRDPFYPQSIRPYAAAIAAAHVAPVSTLVIRGFSGTEEDRTVIINNHSFGVGDEGDVITPSGRVHVRCLAIRSNSVVIEANHQRRELSFSTE